MGAHGLLGTDKDVEDLVRRARKVGWTVEINGGGHICWKGPEGQRFHSALSGSRGTRLHVERNLAVHDPAYFGAGRRSGEMSAPERVDIGAEVDAARQELLGCLELLDILAEGGDAGGAAEVLRLSRSVLREGEDRLRAVLRASRTRSCSDAR